jgi:peptidyl-tRNA hydrolase, PTH1 family
MFKKILSKFNQKESFYLIAGLGNPKQEYQGTRHNVGFEILDFIAQSLSFPSFSFQTNFKAQISQATINDERVILAKPLTFMNLSGQSIKKIVNFYKIPPEKTIIIHDDLDLEFNQMKISWDKGSGGHRGIESIIKETGSQKFIRLRIGISCQEKVDAEKFVLQKFRKNEIIDSKKALELVKLIIKEGPAKASSVSGKS